MYLDIHIYCTQFSEKDSAVINDAFSKFGGCRVQFYAVCNLPDLYYLTDYSLFSLVDYAVWVCPRSVVVWSSCVSGPWV